MNIISYRGPGMAGGVSTALARIWTDKADANSSWWHLCESDLTVELPAGPRKLATFNKELLHAHYTHCNEFLWPIMHDLPQYATYNPENRMAYDRFNEAISKTVLGAEIRHGRDSYFVQDYQFAVLPQLLKQGGHKSAIFWHIPWPKNVRQDFVEPISAIAAGMLSCEAIGFHTEEYARNFLAFVSQHLFQYHCDEDTLEIRPMASAAAAGFIPSRDLIEARKGRVTALRRPRPTKLVVAPLGLDMGHWSTLAGQQDNTVLHPAMMKGPFVLSVDRADYTKGVTHRLKAIDYFFTEFPQWREKIAFAQICGKTRGGIAAFDDYWHECQELAGNLKEKHATNGWQPLHWIETSFSAAQLALLYRSANVMLVNPVRDGLNLTAKEYVACQDRRNSGVLVLSSGAGAASELGQFALTIDPENPAHIAESVHAGLTMHEREKSLRTDLMLQRLNSNPLEKWWHNFSRILEGDKQAKPITQVRGLREIS